MTAFAWDRLFKLSFGNVPSVYILIASPLVNCKSYFTKIENVHYPDFQGWWNVRPLILDPPHLPFRPTDSKATLIMFFGISYPRFPSNKTKNVTNVWTDATDVNSIVMLLQNQKTSKSILFLFYNNNKNLRKKCNSILKWLRRSLEGASKILIFQDAPRFPKLIFQTVLRFHHPPIMIQQVSQCFQTSFRSRRIYLVVRASANYSRFTEIPQSCFFRFYLNRSRLKIALDPPKIRFANFGALYDPTKLKCGISKKVEICNMKFVCVKLFVAACLF